jgi:hypothetical protein
MFRHLARVACVLVIASGSALAGDVSGKIDLPPQGPARPPLELRGFLDRKENATLAPKPFDPNPYLIVVLVPATPPESSPTGTSWDLVGESFARPVIPVRAGAEVTIKNKSKRAVSLTAEQDAKLIPAGPINPSGSRAFTVKTAGLYTVIDKDIPHLRGRLVVVDSPYAALVGGDSKFTFKDVPPGEYKLRLWYVDGWLDRPDDAVTVAAKGDTSVAPKVPVGYKVKAN